jgi:glycosyltransferase involved in cell wall biosynthesis
MKCSIVIISYNEKRYLKEAVESCLRQEVFCDNNAEIIIGDDGSSDGSLEIIKELAEKYPNKIRYFVMDRSDIQYIIPSLRASNVIKKGLELSKGEYLQILSGDDLLIDPKKISVASMFLDNNPEYSCCYTDYKKFWDDGKSIFPKAKKNQFSRPVLWSFEYRHISCYVFRRNVLNNLLDRFCDDTGMFYSCFCTGKAKHIPGVTFGYRQRDTGIMRTSDELELNLLELLLFQDVLNRNSFPKSSLAKFYKPLRFVWNQKATLRNEKYEKYFIESSKYDNDILNLFARYNELEKRKKKQLRRMMVKAGFYRIIFKFFDITESIIR